MRVEVWSSFPDFQLKGVEKQTPKVKRFLPFYSSQEVPQCQPQAWMLADSAPLTQWLWAGSGPQEQRAHL